MKDIRHDTVILGQPTLDEAKKEAARVVGDRVRIVRVEGPYFVVPNGQRCPCCGATAKVEFN